MNICIYGASSNQINNVYIAETERLGEILGSKGHGLVYGGGANGLMGAAARGFVKGGGKVVGIAPSFFNVDGALFEKCDEFIYPDTMRQRKQMMEERADAFVAVPGGIGTFDELFEILALRQLGRHNKPIVLFNVNGYFDRLLEFIDYTVKEGFVCEECKSLVPAFGNAKELVDYLESYNPDEHGFTVLKNIEDK